MRSITSLMVLVVLASACLTGNAIAIQCPLEFSTGTVMEVADGDTLTLETGEVIRLLDINTPEKRENGYQEAKDFLNGQVLGKEIYLGSGCEDKGSYGRLLRYVFLEQTEDITRSVNYMIVAEGLAPKYFYSGSAYEKEFTSAEKSARLQGFGIWSESEHSDCLSVKEFHPDPEGDDRKNLFDEYVVLSNSCGPIDMDGYLLKDESSRNIKTISNFVIVNEMTIRTGICSNTEEQYCLNSKAAIWNNDGDTLFLRDKEGKLLISEKY